MIEKTDHLQHGKILAILFTFYGGSHLLAASFVCLIVLALAGEGYSGRLRELKTLALFGMILLVVVPRLLSGYSLLRGKLWAKGVVLLTCLTIVMISLVGVTQVSRPTLSTNRIIFVILYGGANTAAVCSAMHYCGSPTRCMRSPKRGSERRLSNLGSVLSQIMETECSW